MLFLNMICLTVALATAYPMAAPQQNVSHDLLSCMFAARAEAAKLRDPNEDHHKRITTFFLFPF
jgi:hypothetical protein